MVGFVWFGFLLWIVYLGFGFCCVFVLNVYIDLIDFV